MSQIKFKGKYFTKSDNAAYVKDEYTQQMIDEVIENLVTSKEDVDFTFQATGNTLVAGAKWEDDGEIDIIVTQKYSEACLLKDRYGNYQPIDWGKEASDEYEGMSKEELIDEIKYLKGELCNCYDPRREV